MYVKAIYVRWLEKGYFCVDKRVHASILFVKRRSKFHQFDPLKSTVLLVGHHLPIQGLYVEFRRKVFSSRIDEFYSIEIFESDRIWKCSVESYVFIFNAIGKLVSRGIKFKR